MFQFDGDVGHLKWIPPTEWTLPSVAEWQSSDIIELLDTAQSVLTSSQERMNLQDTTLIIRKERGVGIVPKEGVSICREILEEIVLTAQRKLDSINVTKYLNFSAFNGGQDVWVDIGDKNWVYSVYRNTLGRFWEHRLFMLVISSLLLVLMTLKPDKQLALSGLLVLVRLWKLWMNYLSMWTKDWIQQRLSEIYRNIVE